MIALPGLTLPTGKHDVARSILRTFARHVDQGMLPNRFPDAGKKPEYNTVDATLWFFEAARAYLAYTVDLEFVRNELYAVDEIKCPWCDAIFQPRKKTGIICPHCHQETGIGTAAALDQIFMSRKACRNAGGSS
jgi:glycogen debranching enzyme